MNSIRGRKAFTLIELIIVIVIIGILAGIAVVGYQAVIKRSAEAALQQSARAFDKEVVALGAFDQTAPRVAANVNAAVVDLAGNGYTITPAAASTGTPPVIATATVSKGACTLTVTFGVTVGAAATLSTPTGC